MPFVKGFLKTVKPGHRPGQGLPWPERPTDAGYGVDEGERPEVEPPDIDEIPTPPPGVWPGPTAEHPFEPVPPDFDAEPGTIWPSPGTPGHPIQPGKKLWLLVGVPGHGWKYVCVDPGLLVPSPAPHK